MAISMDVSMDVFSPGLIGQSVGEFRSVGHIILPVRQVERREGAACLLP
jgi:hypothetical protein